MTKICVAPDSFKGTLTAREACEIIACAAKEAMPGVETVCLPLSDGGEGLSEALIEACGGERRASRALDPRGREIEANYALLPDGRAVVETAEAVGLTRLSRAERNPMRASSFGAGQLVRHALADGAKTLVLGLGGSATNDGGMGLAAALGARFLDGAGRPLEPRGANLGFVRDVDAAALVSTLEGVRVTVACDVNNPLCGELGAANVYARQKGASERDVIELDEGLRNLCGAIERQTGRALSDMPGIGAAGGMALPLVAYAGARLVSGLDIVLDEARFEARAADCDLIVTGEGRTDAQSAMGKVVSGVARRAGGKPVIVLSGALGEGAEKLYEMGVTALFSSVRAVCALDDALNNARENLKSAARDLFRLLAATR